MTPGGDGAVDVVVGMVQVGFDRVVVQVGMVGMFHRVMMTWWSE
jgi:hypothetical protein